MLIFLTEIKSEELSHGGMGWMGGGGEVLLMLAHKL